MSPAILRIIKYMWLMLYLFLKICMFVDIPHACQHGSVLYAHHCLRNHGLDGYCDFMFYAECIQWTGKEEVVSVRLSVLPHASTP
jgi:hypothetical protein